jgi:hypothetical protein
MSAQSPADGTTSAGWSASSSLSAAPASPSSRPAQAPATANAAGSWAVPPVRTTLVKRAYGSGPVTSVLPPGWPDCFRDRPRGCPVTLPFGRVLLERSQRRGGASELGADEWRRIIECREGPFVLACQGRGLSPARLAEWPRKHPSGVAHTGRPGDRTPAAASPAPDRRSMEAIPGAPFLAPICGPGCSEPGRSTRSAAVRRSWSSSTRQR